MADLIPEPDVPPVSATQAMAHVENMISILGLWHKGRGQQAQTAQIMRRWLLQIRPHMRAAVKAAEGGADG